MDSLLSRTTFYSPCGKCHELLCSRSYLLTTSDWDLVAISSGAFGSVFEATCRPTGCRHAVKVISNSNTASREFHMVNLRAAARNRNLATIICTGFSNHADIVSASNIGAYVVIQELLLVDLFDLINTTIAVPSQSCMMKHIASAMFWGLNDLHDIGVIHGDPKLENLMLSEAGELKIIDFGNSYHISESRRVGGTYQYLPPEHVFGQWNTGNGGDVFAAAILLIEVWLRSNLFPQSMADAYNYHGDNSRLLEQHSMAPLYHIVLLSSFVAGREVWAGTILRKYYGKMSKCRMYAKVIRSFPCAGDEIFDLLYKLRSIQQHDPEFYHFIRTLCQPVERRPSVAEALNHPWFLLGQ